MTKVIGRFDPGERVECYVDESATQRYLVGTVAKVTADRATFEMVIDVEQPVPEVTFEDEPEEAPGGFPRPTGWT